MKPTLHGKNRKYKIETTEVRGGWGGGGVSWGGGGEAKNHNINNTNTNDRIMFLNIDNCGNIHNASSQLHVFKMLFKSGYCTHFCNPQSALRKKR